LDLLLLLPHIKKEHSYYQKGTHQKGTLILSKGTLKEYSSKGTH